MSSTLFIVLLLGLPLLMILMHRGGHSGMGCGMGHGRHSGRSGDEHRNGARERDSGEQDAKPLLGRSGTVSSPSPVRTKEHRHRGC